MTDEIGELPKRKYTRKTDRRRKGAAGGARAKLGVNEAALDRENFEYRWINDAKNRVHDLTQDDDWDLVSDPKKAVKEDGSDLGSAVSRIVGEGAGSEPMRAYLVKKPKKFHIADQAEKQASIDKTMAAIEAGGDQGPNTYVPEGGMKVSYGAAKPK